MLMFYAGHCVLTACVEETTFVQSPGIDRRTKPQRCSDLSRTNFTHHESAMSANCDQPAQAASSRCQSLAVSRWLVIATLADSLTLMAFDPTRSINAWGFRCMHRQAAACPRGACLPAATWLPLAFDCANPAKRGERAYSTARRLHVGNDKTRRGSHLAESWLPG